MIFGNVLTRPLDTSFLASWCEVYTINHEVVPIARSCKICDWLLKLSWEHFGSHQAKLLNLLHITSDGGSEGITYCESLVVPVLFL